MPAKPNLYLTALLLAVCLLLAVPGMPETARAEQVRITVEGDPPWTIEADEVTAYQNREVYVADGSVKLTRGQEVITGDSARYNAASQTAEVHGNVVMTSPDFKVVCERLAVNIRHNIGKIYNGKIFFPQNHYYVAGDEIEKTGPDSFLILQGRATTCDGPNPAWTLTGTNITVEREGYAAASNATFSTRFFPVLYLPYMRVPIKSKRQSGILTPAVGNSTRDGFTFTLPVYWAVSDSKDMTIYLNTMTKRGLETTVEGRFNDWGGKGTFRASYLRDQTSPDVYYSKPGREIEVNDRYWIRGMSDLETKSGFSIKFDVDYASDPDYIDEFKDSLTGYEDTRRVLLNEFGREPAEPLDPLRKSTFLATKTINSQNLKFALEYTTDLRDPDNLETIQRLPKINLDMTRQGIAGTPFYFSDNAEYTYFSRKTTDESTLKEQGHRLDIYPRFFWPVKLFSALDMESSLGLRETLYYPHGMNVDPANPDDDRNHRFYHREMYDVSFQASTNVSRVFDVGMGRVDKIRHRIKPEFEFTLVPDVYQGDLPYWDSLDRITESRRIRYGVVNYFVARLTPEDVFPRVRDDSGNTDYTYVEFMRFSVHRSYDFVEESRDLEERSPGLMQDFRRPHSPWELELDLYFRPWFWMEARSQYDTYMGHFINHDWEARIQDGRGDYLGLEYEMNLEPYQIVDREKFEYEELRGTLYLKLDEEWAVAMEKRYSIPDDSDIESIYTLSYRPQCWGVRLQYIDKPDDRAIAVFFSLLGLGEIAGYTHKTESGGAAATSDTLTSY